MPLGLKLVLEYMLLRGVKANFLASPWFSLAKKHNFHDSGWVISTKEMVLVEHSQPCLHVQIKHDSLIFKGKLFFQISLLSIVRDPTEAGERSGPPYNFLLRGSQPGSISSPYSASTQQLLSLCWKRDELCFPALQIPQVRVYPC